MNVTQPLDWPFVVGNPAINAGMPAAITAWTEREYDLLLTLTRRLRIMSLTQLQRIWCPTERSQRSLRRRLRALIRAELLERYIVNAHPLVSIDTPLAAWAPGQSAPDPFPIAARARARWNQPSRPLEVVAASRRASCLFGANYCGLPPLLHRDHDLLLTQVYVHYRIHRPTCALKWLGEDALPKAGYQIKDPDAFLVSDTGIPYKVIESAGRYGTQQVRTFHDYCAEYDIAYELW